MYHKLWRAESRLLEELVSREKRPFGTMFYERDNPEFYEWNHCRQENRLKDEETAQAVTSFYQSVGITPKIFTDYVDEAYAKLLERCGYEVEIGSSSGCFFREKGAAVLNTNGEDNFTLREIDGIPGALRELVMEEDTLFAQYGMDYTLRGLNRYQKREGFHLYGLYGEERLLGMGSLLPVGDYQRLDHIIVAKKCRGRGVGAALVRGILNRAHSGVFLWAEGEGARALYWKTGFRELPGQGMFAFGKEKN